MAHGGGGGSQQLHLQQQLLASSPISPGLRHAAGSLRAPPAGSGNLQQGGDPDDVFATHIVNLVMQKFQGAQAGGPGAAAGACQAKQSS